MAATRRNAARLRGDRKSRSIVLRPDQLPDLRNQTVLDLSAKVPDHFSGKIIHRESPRLLRSVALGLGTGLRSISETGKYELILTHEQRKQLGSGAMELVTGDQGIRAILRNSKTKDFAANIQLRRLGPEVGGALVGASIQASLASVESRLIQIEEGIRAILRGQHSDRIAQVRAGIEIFDCALAAYDYSTRQQLLRDACTRLVLGKSLLLTFLEREVSELCLLEGNADRFQKFLELFTGKTQADEMTERLPPLQENVLGAIVGTRYAVAGFAQLGEDGSAKTVLEQTRGRLSPLAEDVARLSPLLLTGLGGIPRSSARFWSHDFGPAVDGILLKPADVRRMTGPLVLRFEGQKLLSAGTSKEDG